MITPLIILSSVGLIMAALLAVGRKAFAVEVDEKQEKINDILPGANCGGCGYAGCSGYAAALAKGEADPTLCPPGGADLATQIGEILGVSVEQKEPMVALIACAGTDAASPATVEYLGMDDCTAAAAIYGAKKACRSGCLGLGSCINACPFDAIVKLDNGMVMVLKDKCTGCGKCVDICPRGVIKMVPKKETVHVLCVNPDKAKAVKAVCSVGCTGCKICTKQTKRIEVKGAIAMVTPGEADIPESAALACPQMAILDEREYGLKAWLSDPSAKETFGKKAAEWKEAEKAKKAAAKEAKAKKAEEKAAKEKAEAEKDGGEA